MSRLALPWLLLTGLIRLTFARLLAGTFTGLTFAGLLARIAALLAGLAARGIGACDFFAGRASRAAAGGTLAGLRIDLFTCAGGTGRRIAAIVAAGVGELAFVAGGAGGGVTALPAARRSGACRRRTADGLLTGAGHLSIQSLRQRVDFIARPAKGFVLVAEHTLGRALHALPQPAHALFGFVRRLLRFVDEAAVDQAARGVDDFIGAFLAGVADGVVELF